VRVVAFRCEINSLDSFRFVWKQLNSFYRQPPFPSWFPTIALIVIQCTLQYRSTNAGLRVRGVRNCGFLREPTSRNWSKNSRPFSRVVATSFVRLSFEKLVRPAYDGKRSSETKMAPENEQTPTEQKPIEQTPIEQKLKAIDAFKDWSNYLLVTTVAALGWTTAEHAASFSSLSIKVACILLFADSIVFAILTLALIPHVAENPEVKDKSIYNVRWSGWLKGDYELVDFCLPQHVFFLLGILVYAGGTAFPKEHLNPSCWTVCIAVILFLLPFILVIITIIVGRERRKNGLTAKTWGAP
jgi:hypothetical protein